MNHITNEDALTALIMNPNVNPNQVGDGYHTFGDLYKHRIALFKALCRILVESKHFSEYDQVWKSRRHSDYSQIPGWFILGIRTDRGHQISYHLPESEWLNTDFATALDVAPAWDGHTGDDVINRINALML